MPHGKLNVVVDGASDIKPPRGKYGKGGSYCTLACGTQVFTSPTVEGGGSYPCFKTAFEFEIDSTTNSLNVCVYNKGSSSRDDQLVGLCTLNFKKVFFHGHTVPLTAFPIQHPTGTSGGKISMSLKFKMRRPPNGRNTQAPMRYSPRTLVTHTIVGRQTVSLDWGYEDHREELPEAQRSRRTKSDLEGDLKMPGSASSKVQEVSQLPHEEYRNFPGSASSNYQEPNQPDFIRYNSASSRRPSNPPPQTPNLARPSPIMEYNQPLPGTAHYDQHIPPQPLHYQPIPPPLQYNQQTPPQPQYHQRIPPPLQYYQQTPPQPQYHQRIPPQLQYHQPQNNQQVVEVVKKFGSEMANELASEMVKQLVGGAGQSVLDGFCNV